MIVLVGWEVANRALRRGKEIQEVTKHGAVAETTRRVVSIS
jgi:hypothetical protein